MHCYKSHRRLLPAREHWVEHACVHMLKWGPKSHTVTRVVNYRCSRTIIDACYSPPADGCKGVVYAATVPWDKDRRTVNGTPVLPADDLRCGVRLNKTSNGGQTLLPRSPKRRRT